MTSTPPRLSQEEATELAIDYLAGQDIDMGDRSLHEARWLQSSTTNTWAWVLKWMTAEQAELTRSQPSLRGGGMLEVQVTDQGQLSHSFAR